MTFRVSNSEILSKPLYSQQRYSLDIYRIYWNKRPSLLIAPPPSSLPLQSSYFGVLHPSQQPTPLRDSEKWCVLVLPKRISRTRNKENKNKTWQFWSQTHWNLQKYKIKLYNFFKFKVYFQYFKAVSPLYMLTSEIKATSVHYRPLPLDSRFDFAYL